MFNISASTELRIKKNVEILNQFILDKLLIEPYPDAKGDWDEE
jgi:hypothetical protein